MIHYIQDDLQTDWEWVLTVELWTWLCQYNREHAQ